MRPAMENPALRNDAIVDMGGRVVGQSNGRASEAGESVLEEMEFEEIVDENQWNKEKAQQVVREGDDEETAKQKGVAIGGWWGWFAIDNGWPIHGYGVWWGRRRELERQRESNW